MIVSPEKLLSKEILEQIISFQASSILLICLANYGLGLPAPAGPVGGVVGNGGGEYYDEHPDPFHYKYGVHDDKYYTDFGEERTGDEAGNMKGEYYVHLPDGRVQHVIYHADGNYGGTVMEVRYDGEAKHPDYHGHGNGGHV